MPRLFLWDAVTTLICTAQAAFGPQLAISKALIVYDPARAHRRTALEQLLALPPLSASASHLESIPSVTGAGTLELDISNADRPWTPTVNQLPRRQPKRSTRNLRREADVLREGLAHAEREAAFLRAELDARTAQAAVDKESLEHNRRLRRQWSQSTKDTVASIENAAARCKQLRTSKPKLLREEDPASPASVIPTKSEKRVKEHVSKNAEADNLRTEIERLEKRVVEQDASIHAIKSANTTLTRERDEAISDISALRSSHSSALSQERVERESLSSALAERDEQLSVAENTLYTLRLQAMKECLRNRSEMDALKTEIENLKSEKAEVRGCLSAYLMQVKGEKMRLCDELNVALVNEGVSKRRVDALNAVVLRVYDEKVQLHEKLGGAIANLQSEKTAARAEAHALRKQLDAKSKVLVDMAEEVDTLRCEVAAHEEEHELLAKEVAERNANFIELQAQMRAAQRQYEDAVRHIDGELHNLRTENANLTEGEKMLSKRNLALRLALRKARHTADFVPELEKERDELQKSLANMANLANAAQDRLQNVEAQLVDMRTKQVEKEQNERESRRSSGGRRGSGPQSAPSSPGAVRRATPANFRFLGMQLGGVLRPASPSRGISEELATRVKDLTEEVMDAHTRANAAEKELKEMREREAGMRLVSENKSDAQI